MEDLPTDSAPPPATKHGSKRSAAQRSADLLIIETNVLKGRSQAEIVELLAAIRPYRVSRSQVSYEVAKLKRLWIEAAVESHGAAKARELKSLDAILATAWDAWEKSTAGGEAGNPAFLEKALGVHDRKARLLGLNTAERHELSGPQGGPIAIFNKPLSEEAQQEILRRHFERERRYNANCDQPAGTPASA